MKKTVVNFLSIICYIILLNIQLGIFVGINMSINGKPVGGLTAIGGVFSLWSSYKITQSLRLKFLNN
jgi:hypothetical protein|tara:strand:- start:2087 stop:2287 length:201 start_codon:yes stop_codon:yes gene_type:complete